MSGRYLLDTNIIIFPLKDDWTNDEGHGLRRSFFAG
jgi:hypothetical protein